MFVLGLGSALVEPDGFQTSHRKLRKSRSGSLTWVWLVLDCSCCLVIGGSPLKRRNRPSAAHLWGAERAPGGSDDWLHLRRRVGSR